MIAPEVDSPDKVTHLQLFAMNCNLALGLIPQFIGLALHSIETVIEKTKPTHEDANSVMAFGFPAIVHLPQGPLRQDLMGFAQAVSLHGTTRTKLQLGGHLPKAIVEADTLELQDQCVEMIRRLAPLRRGSKYKETSASLFMRRNTGFMTALALAKEAGQTEPVPFWRGPEPQPPAPAPRKRPATAVASAPSQGT
jgi:hypothetical protein